MQRSQIEHLYYIAHLDNLKSILRQGILCHNKVDQIGVHDISNQDVQTRRKKVIPGTQRKLHDNVNLYLNPRNAMMFVIREAHEDLCVLGLSRRLLQIEGATITDGNAASDWTSFYESPDGLAKLDESLIMARYWTDEDIFVYYTKKRSVCAEVLIPSVVSPSFIEKIYVSCKGTKKKVIDLLGNHPLSKHVVIDADMFFQEEVS